MTKSTSQTTTNSGLARQIFLAASSLLILGCASPMQPSPPAAVNTDTLQDITYGNIKRELRIGESTQEHVVMKFGSPNNMVLRGKGGELWIYDRVRTESFTETKSHASGVGIGGVGIGSSGAAGLSMGSSMSESGTRNTSSIRTLTVILEFDERGILRDLSARQGGY